MFQNSDLLSLIFSFLSHNELIGLTPNKRFTIYSRAALLEHEYKKENKKFENWINNFITRIQSDRIFYSNDMFNILKTPKIFLSRDLSAYTRLKIIDFVFTQFPNKQYSSTVIQKVEHFVILTLSSPELKPLTLAFFINFLKLNAAELENMEILENLLSDLRQGLNREKSIQEATIQALARAFPAITNLKTRRAVITDWIAKRIEL